MRTIVVLLSALILGSLVGTAWSVMEYRDPGPDVQTMIDQLQSPGDPQELRQPGTPRAVVDQGDEYDFGVMDLTETKSHTFVVRNEGDAPLTLKLLGTTCKCAIGTLPEGAIPPGDTGEVALEWTAKGEAPEYRQSATIETNDPAQKVLYLSVYGKVTQVVRAVPRAVIFTDIPASESRDATFDVLNFKEPVFEIVGVRWDNVELGDSFDLAWEPMTPEQLEASYGAASGMRCTLTAKAGLPMGAFRNLLTLSLSTEERRELMIPVRGNVVTDIRIAGPGYRDQIGLLNLGMVPREGTTRSLLILAKGTHRDELQIEVAETQPDDVLRATVGEGIPINDGAVWKFPLEISVLPNSKAMSFLDSGDQEPALVKLRTNHPRVQELDIRVSFATGGD